MTTQPTQNPVPSESPSDLKFNAGKIDEFVTSLVNTYTDRFGTEHYTIEGLRQLAQEAIAAFGWVPVDSFQDGATLTLPNQVLRWKLPDGDGEYYRWDGTLPKEVPADSTPEASGGVGAGAWVAVGDSSLRALLGSQGGDKHIGSSFGGSVYSDYAVSDIRRLSPGDTLQNKYEVVSPDGETFYMWSGDFPKKTNLSFNPQNEDGWVNVGSAKYKIGDIRNYPSDMQDNDKLTNALLTKELAIIPSGFSINLTGSYVAPAGSKGITGDGELSYNGTFKVAENVWTTPVLMEANSAAGEVEIYIDGTNRVGQYVKIDNGRTFLVSDANSGAENSVDGVALTEKYSDYQSQFIQVCKIIGHTSANKSVLSAPLLVNQKSGVSKYSFISGDVQSFILTNLTIRCTANEAKNFLIQGVINSRVDNCKFYNCIIQNNYACFNCEFTNNEIHDLTGHSQYRFDSWSNTAIISGNKIFSRGYGDADILVYRQVCYVTVQNNVVLAPLSNTAYTSSHWAIALHTCCYKCIVSGNVTASKSGIGDLFFNSDNVISSNSINCASLSALYCINSKYSGNKISTQDWSTFQGGQYLKFENNDIFVNVTSGQKMYGFNFQTRGSNKPFGYAGFKSIEFGTVVIKDNRISASNHYGFLDPKSLMSSPVTAADDQVFPLNDTHLNGQQCFIHGSNTSVNTFIVDGNHFKNWNYAMSWYVDSSLVSFCDIVVKNNTFETCDVALCFRGRVGNFYFRGHVADNWFMSGVYAIVDANADGVDCERNHVGNYNAGILVASNKEDVHNALWSDENTFDRIAEQGFKVYDFNGYAYDTAPNLNRVSLHKSGMNFYLPAENMGGVRDAVYRVNSRYIGSAYSGKVIKRTLNETVFA